MLDLENQWKNYWGVVGFSYDTANEIICDIEQTYGKNILRKFNNGQMISTIFEDGVSLRWIPATTSSRGYRFGKMWCDRTISDEIRWYIYPMFFGREDDIVWL